jgi:hypothetical protein
VFNGNSLNQECQWRERKQLVPMVGKGMEDKAGRRRSRNHLQGRTPPAMDKVKMPKIFF